MCLSGNLTKCGRLPVTNRSDRVRDLTLTGYAEFTNHSNYEQDQVNLQYSLFITRTLFEKNRIIQQIHGNLDALREDEEVDDKKVTERFFALAGGEVSSYCGDKDAFLGKYHGYGNPQGVISADLGNITSYNENSLRRPLLQSHSGSRRIQDLAFSARYETLGRSRSHCRLLHGSCRTGQTGDQCAES